MGKRIKIFEGKNCMDIERKFNSWIDDNNDVDIIDFKYQKTYAPYDNIRYSICVLYKK